MNRERLTQPGQPVLSPSARRWRDLWPWDLPNVILYLVVPTTFLGITILLLLPSQGSRILWLLFAEVFPVGFALTYGWVGSRVRKLKASSPAAGTEMTEALMFRRPWQSPGIAALHEDRLELIPIAGAKSVIQLQEIAAVKEVRWFNGTRLWFKRGLVLETLAGERIGLAVPDALGARWLSRLSREKPNQNR